MNCLTFMTLLFFISHLGGNGKVYNGDQNHFLYDISLRKLIDYVIRLQKIRIIQTIHSHNISNCYLLQPRVIYSQAKQTSVHIFIHYLIIVVASYIGIFVYLLSLFLLVSFILYLSSK